MISGSIVYDRFGFAMRWLFEGNQIAAISFLIVGIGGLVAMAKKYSSHFLRICIYKTLLNEGSKRRDFLIIVVLLPWITATMLLTPWDYLQHDYYSILQNVVLFIFSTVAVFSRPHFAIVSRKAELKNSAGIGYYDDSR